MQADDSDGEIWKRALCMLAGVHQSQTAGQRPDARSKLHAPVRLSKVHAYQDLLTVAALKAVAGQQQLGGIGEDALWVLIGVALQGALQEGAKGHGGCRGDGGPPTPTPPAAIR